MSYPNRMTAHLKQEKLLLGNLMKLVSAKKYIIRSAELHLIEYLVHVVSYNMLVVVVVCQSEQLC